MPIKKNTLSESPFIFALILLLHVKLLLFSKEEKNKGKEQSRKVGSVDIPDSLLNLQATVDRIEQIFGGAKQQIPEASEGTQLASPRFVSQVMPLADKGSQKI